MRKIAVIPGDGIGPEIVEAALAVLDALDCGLEYEFTQAGQTALDEDGELLPAKTLDLIRTLRVGLKGPVTTPVGKGFSSVNVALRRHFDLYANLRPALSFPGVASRYENVDVITVRENTEGLYSGQETVSEDGDEARAVAVVSRAGSERVVRFAFEMARRRGRKKVTAVHKANILKKTSGLFLEAARAVAKDYGDIEFDDLIVDNACMQLVLNPSRFDVIVTTNLFGDIISDLCAGLVGGLGMVPGANIGEDVAVFEAVHGSAPDIAGKGVANPCALLLAAALMLDYLEMRGEAERVRGAIRRTLKAGECLTPDLGGHCGTRAFTQVLIDAL